MVPLTMSSYEALPGLDAVYLEDSFVLGIGESPHELVFELDAVLTPSSPAYSPPLESQQYCYRRGRLIFGGAGITWLARSEARYTDGSGEEDLGNIDVFTARGRRYYLEGDWGSVAIESDEQPRFELSSSLNFAAEGASNPLDVVPDVASQQAPAPDQHGCSQEGAEHKRAKE